VAEDAHKRLSVGSRHHKDSRVDFVERVRLPGPDTGDVCLRAYDRAAEPVPRPSPMKWVATPFCFC